jgi:hypothetical protein
VLTAVSIEDEEEREKRKVSQRRSSSIAIGKYPKPQGNTSGINPTE